MSELKAKNPNCPLVSVAAVKVIGNDLSIVAKVEGHHLTDIAPSDTAFLVPRIESPREFSRHIRYVRSTPDGVVIGVSRDEPIVDLKLVISDRCVVRTVKTD